MPSSQKWTHAELGAAFAVLLEKFPRASLTAFARAGAYCRAVVRHGPVSELTRAMESWLEDEQNGVPHPAPPPKRPKRARRMLVVTERELRRPRELAGRERSLAQYNAFTRTEGSVIPGAPAVDHISLTH